MRNYIGVQSHTKKATDFFHRPIFCLICATKAPTTSTALTGIIATAVSVLRRCRISTTVYDSSIHREKAEPVGISVGIRRSSIARRSATTVSVRLRRIGGITATAGTRLRHIGCISTLVHANIPTRIPTNKLRCATATATIVARPRITRIAHNYFVPSFVFEDRPHTILYART